MHLHLITDKGIFSSPNLTNSTGLITGIVTEIRLDNTLDANIYIQRNGS
jgi:hypothetical protein